MPGLTLTLKPNERFLVGGHLLQNGPKRAAVTIRDESVLVLRLSDAIPPEEATTPVRRAYFAAQRIMAADVTPDEGRPPLLSLLGALASVFRNTPFAETVERATEAAEARRYHGTLAALATLFPVEDAMLSSRDRSCSATG